MIYFVGAGPGDVDLITVKGRRVLERAQLVVFAGSLVWERHLDFCRSGCVKRNSASMTLEEIMAEMIVAVRRNRIVVRLHTGDPTLYGAIGEQMAWLDREKIEYEVIPGVSSFTASCAVLKREFTLPGVSQTVIVTRLAGRTPVPESEDLESLASHKCSMAIFLSVRNIRQVAAKLAKGYGRGDVPVAVVYRATWQDQKVVTGTLRDIAEKVERNDIEKTAQILVGDFIECGFERSRLYSPRFSHEYRTGV